MIVRLPPRPRLDHAREQLLSRPGRASLLTDYPELQPTATAYLAYIRPQILARRHAKQRRRRALLSILLGTALFAVRIRVRRAR